MAFVRGKLGAWPATSAPAIAGFMERGPAQGQRELVELDNAEHAQEQPVTSTNNDTRADPRPPADEERMSNPDYYGLGLGVFAIAVIAYVVLK